MNKFIFPIIILSLLFFSLNKKTDLLEVDFLDVGQGDAILIKTPTGKNILIDGGADNKLLSQLADNLAWWEREIDYLVITHFHADHIMGLPELLNKYKVKNILVSNHQTKDFLYQLWSDRLIEKKLSAQIVGAGERFVIAEDLYWQVLSADDYHEDYNDNSVVIRLTHGSIDFLFTGDLPTTGEDKILATDLVLESEVLKIGHHGSKYSSGEEFLKAVSPQICVIQSGKDNKFGHPHPETINRLTNIGCQIKDTQNQGLIKIFSDGQTLRP
ncbi:MBL fold metallo-hydrolase [Candidatus Parcubacteria bacterium]|jgi:competence protein ComEC|nr:MBL fold metallo-hydrolase [Candidatus Parcubacteria bacterium]MBT7228108.1 MBL fold metallo-hydrolase [Candidatus Parcubacteria bacterium]